MQITFLFRQTENIYSKANEKIKRKVYTLKNRHKLGAWRIKHTQTRGTIVMCWLWCPRSEANIAIEEMMQISCIISISLPTLHASFGRVSICSMFHPSRSVTAALLTALLTDCSTPAPQHPLIQLHCYQLCCQPHTYTYHPNPLSVLGRHPLILF